jgi:hypothetical protein
MARRREQLAAAAEARLKALQKSQQLWSVDSWLAQPPLHDPLLAMHPAGGDTSFDY